MRSPPLPRTRSRAVRQKGLAFRAAQHETALGLRYFAGLAAETVSREDERLIAAAGKLSSLPPIQAGIEQDVVGAGHHLCSDSRADPKVIVDYLLLATGRQPPT